MNVPDVTIDDEIYISYQKNMKKVYEIISQIPRRTIISFVLFLMVTSVTREAFETAL